MKKYCFEIVISAVCFLSVLDGMGQAVTQPVLERHSSSQQKTKKDVIVPPSELKKSSQTETNINKSKADSLQQLPPPQLKRADSSPMRKDNIKNTK